jgi:hypothetical protein
MSTASPTPSPTPEDTHIVEEVCPRAFGQFACLNLSGSSFLLILILLGLIVTVLLLEYIQHLIKHAMSGSAFWKTFYHAIESELTNLGLLSFVLFILSQALGEANTHESEQLSEFIELVEFMHIILFITMITYILFIAMAAREAQRFLNAWRVVSSLDKKKQIARFIAGGVTSYGAPTLFKRFLKVAFCWPGIVYRNLQGVEELEGEEETLVGAFDHSDGGEDYDDDVTHDVRDTISTMSDVQLVYSVFNTCVDESRKSKYRNSAGVKFMERQLRLKSVNTDKGKKRKFRLDIFQVATSFVICDAFLRAHGLPRDLPFSYIDYVQACVTHTFSKIVHLGWRLWSLFLLLLILLSVAITLYRAVFNIDTTDLDNAFNTNPNDNEPVMNLFNVTGWVMLCLVLNSKKNEGSTLAGLLKIVADGEQDSSPSEGAPASVPLQDPLLNRSTSTNLIDNLDLPQIKGKSMCATFCPRFSSSVKEDEYRKAFTLYAPDWNLRLYQATVFFYGLFISLSITVFVHVDGYYLTVLSTLLFPFFIIGSFGYRSPKFVSLRYFGPTLHRKDIYQELVDKAWVKYENGERLWDTSNERDVKAMDEMYNVLMHGTARKEHK